jgi:hypothetical protein
MDQIIANKFELITLFSAVLIIVSSCLYIITLQNQRSIIINAFLNITGLLMLAAALTRQQNIEILWLTLISVLSVVVIWSAVVHLYYRKAEKN